MERALPLPEGTATSRVMGTLDRGETMEVTVLARWPWMAIPASAGLIATRSCLDNRGRVGNNQDAVGRAASAVR